MGLIEIAVGIITILIAWIAKLSYTLKNKEIEDAIAESEVSHRQAEIKDFEAMNKKEYDEMLDYINNDSTLDKF